jgi:hypothetical protein
MVTAAASVVFILTAVREAIAGVRLFGWVCLFAREKCLFNFAKNVFQFFQSVPVPPPTKSSRLANPKNEHVKLYCDKKCPF